jgi:hypothetical protein
MKRLIFLLLISSFLSQLFPQSYNTTWVGAFNTPTKAFDVKVQGRFAYVVGWEEDYWGGYFGSFSIIDVQFPSAPNLISSIYINDAYGIDVIDNYAFLAESNAGLTIYNISNPANPFLVGQKILPSSAKDVKVIGSLAYVADEYAGLRIIDISDVQNPVEIGFFDTPGRSYDVEIIDSLAYVADLSGGLLCINISNPSNPTLISNFAASDQIIDVDIKDSHAYFTDGYSGIKVINITNPLNLTLVDELYMPYWCLGIKVVDDFAYVAAWEFGGLRIVDVSDPANLQEVGFYNTWGKSRDIDVIGSLAYIADWDGGGLQIINNNLINPLSVETNSINLPARFQLEQNYPNPFNPITLIKYQLPLKSSVTLKIFDILGKEVETLVNEERDAGYYEVKFNGSNLSSGIYFYTLQTENYFATKKMILLK